MRVDNLFPFKLVPEYRDYVWGGQRLRPGQKTAEAWVVYENDVIVDGPLAGQTLAQAMQQVGAALVGSSLFLLAEQRFPLLIKLLDCADWLSVQVHPDDGQAQRLEGDGVSGKTEAWHVIDAMPGAELIAGVLPGVSQPRLLEALDEGRVLDVVQRRVVSAGDTVYVPAGTIHALGPGLLVYEVQQTADLTYRIYDWDRPVIDGRTLHVEKARKVVDVNSGCFHHSLPCLGDGQRAVLAMALHFRLDLLALQHQSITLPAGRGSFQTLTVTEGAVELVCGAQRMHLARLETAFIPAASPDCQIQPLQKSRALMASIPTLEESFKALSGGLL